MSKELLSGNYYLISVGLILLSFVVFFLSFEKKKPQVREIVTLAVMCAIAVASRVIFSVIPNFKPVLGVIMLTGMALGPGAGFLTGAMTAFVSNFIFGQGPWTPWQMFAYGTGGFLFGLLAQAQLLPKRRWLLSLLGAAIIFFLVGPLLDTSTVVTMRAMADSNYVFAIYLAGVGPNADHAAATFITLYLCGEPLLRKLRRVQQKYGL